MLAGAVATCSGEPLFNSRHAARTRAVGGCLQDGARQSFVAELASRYGLRLRRFFTQRLRNRADAPDLAQEVFLRLMRVEHYETIRSPEAYLFTVASHVLHQHTLRQSGVPASIDISEVFGAFQVAMDDDPMVRVDALKRLEEVERGPSKPARHRSITDLPGPR